MFSDEKAAARFERTTPRYRAFSAPWQWSVVKKLAQSPISRYVIFIPIVGYLLLFNDTAVATLFQFSALVGTAAAAISVDADRLRFLYFGLNIYAIGVAIYLAGAPAVVQRYGGLNDFVSTQADRLSSEVLRTYFEYVLRGVSQDAIDAAWSKTSPDDPAMRRSIAARYYVSRNTSAPLIAGLAGVLCLVGLALTIVPSALLFWEVAIQTADRLNLPFPPPS